MNKHTLVEPGEATEQFQLDEIERHATALERAWMNRVVWDLDTAEPGDLHASTVELVQQATAVLDVLERVHGGVARARAAAE